MENRSTRYNPGTGSKASYQACASGGVLLCSQAEYVAQLIADEHREKRNARKERRKSVSLPVIHFGEVK